MVSTESGGPPIVTGVDASDSARHAAEWAADLAAAHRCPLHLVHVVLGHDDENLPPATPRWLSEIVASAVRSGADAADSEVVVGAPEQLLVQRAAGARMLVIGSYGAAASSGTVVGRVGLAVIEGASCPVAVVRGGAPQLPPPRQGPVVVGVDGSPAATRALRLGTDLAAATGAELLAVHAFTDISETGGAPHRRQDWARLVVEAEEELDAALASAVEHGPKVRSRRDVVAGTTLRVLMDLAGSARMIVVGQRDERVASGAMLLGSTSRGLVQFAPCPVVVVPATARAEGRVDDAAASAG
jgi:nucleotide-binding universal stress UspA family protein